MNICEMIKAHQSAGDKFIYSCIENVYEILGFGKTPEEAFKHAQGQADIIFVKDLTDRKRDGMLELITSDGCREAFCTIASLDLWNEYKLNPADFTD